jgi:hypothetical protein
VRSGDEPLHARSPLRLRLGLALFGVADGVAGVVLFLLLGSPVFAGVFAAVILIAAVNTVVVARHIRAGPHYQPGRDVPPYRPVDRFPDPPREQRVPAAQGARRRRYVVAMGVCVLLLALAWGWIRFYSVGAAVAMSAVAALIPPLAAIVTNADSPILHEDDQDPDADSGSNRDRGGPRGPV